MSQPIVWFLICAQSEGNEHFVLCICGGLIFCIETDWDTARLGHEEFHTGWVGLSAVLC